MNQKRGAHAALVSVLLFSGALIFPSVAHADDSPQNQAPKLPSKDLKEAKDANASEGFVRSPMYQPTLTWFFAQLVPSPEVIGGSQGAAWGLKWQLTAASYSWGVYRKISPWRFGVVDPTARQSGSVELYLAPEYVDTTDPQLFARFGTRAYFPLWERGEFLSASLGASIFEYNDTWAASYEVGLYGLGGLGGIQFTYSPREEHFLVGSSGNPAGVGPIRFITTLALRFF